MKNNPSWYNVCDERVSSQVLLAKLLALPMTGLKTDCNCCAGTRVWLTVVFCAIISFLINTFI